MSFTVRAHVGGGFGVIRMEGVEGDADAEKVMFLLEDRPSARGIGFAMATWSIYLATAAGEKQGDPLPFNHQFAPAGSIVNVWVEPKPGTAPGEPWGLVAGLVGLGC